MIESPFKKIRRVMGEFYAIGMSSAMAMRYGNWLPPGHNSPGGVAVVGSLARRTGISRGAELQAEAFRSIGRQTRLLDATASLRNPFARLPGPLTESVAIVHTGGPQLALALNFLSPAVGKIYRIGYVAWELPAPPYHWRGFDGAVNEIWTPSAFSTNALREVARQPVYTVPHVTAVPSTTARGLARARHGIDKDAFLVLTFADLRSSLARKNPMGTIRAFRAAFGERRDVCLVVKLTAAQWSERLVKSLMEAAGPSNIKFIDQYMSEAELWSLFVDADALLSLHRAEGFGIPMLEAMSAGCTVIATNWSGNTDFMNDSTAALVPYRLVPVRDPQGLYKRGVWAEPDLDVAIEWLRKLESDRKLCADLAAAARAAKSIDRQLAAFRSCLPESVSAAAIEKPTEIVAG